MQKRLHQFTIWHGLLATTLVAGGLALSQVAGLAAVVYLAALLFVVAARIEHRNPRLAVGLMLASFSLPIAYIAWESSHATFRPSRHRTVRRELQSLKIQLEVFRMDMGRFPTPAEGLRVLLNPPAGGGNWGGPYADGGMLPIDPWSNGYRYAVAYDKPHVGDCRATVVSNGPDGKPQTGDDISITFP